MQYLRGIGGNKSIDMTKAIVHDVEEFLRNCPHGSSTTTPVDLLLNRKVLESYYHQMRDIKLYKPTTITEKFRRLKMAIAFLIHEGHDNDDLYIKGNRIIDVLSHWIKSLSKAIGKQRQQHGLKVIDTLATESPTEAAARFLSDTQLLAKVELAILNLGLSFHSRDIKLLTAFATSTLLYKNSQRPGVIQNLTMKEFSQRQHIEYNNEQRVVLPCVNHKTGPQGVAQLVSTLEGEQILLQYHTLVRTKITPKPGCDHLLFLTCTGNKYTQVYRKICTSIKVNNINVKVPPPPSMFRIGMSTKVAKELSDTKRRGVIKHMSHTEQTSQKYYEFVNFEDAAKAFEEINKLM